MRKFAVVLAGVVASVLFAGCTSTAPQTPAQTLVAVHQQVSIACAAAGPSLTSIKALEPGLTADQAAIVDKVYTDATAFCAAHDSVSVASVSAFANTAIPTALKLVNASSLSQDDKTLIAIGVIAMQAALNTALAQYNAAQPASAPVATSSAQ